MTDDARTWRDLDPAAMTQESLPYDGIEGPLLSDGVSRCPWPWDPQQIPAGFPLGQYHCPYCGEMCVASMPHIDYADTPPMMACPRCGETQPDHDGLGVGRCEACGYCAHVSYTGDVCDTCGAAAP